MQKLKTHPPTPVVIGIVVVALAETAILWLQFPPIESRLKSAGYGIVDYELAFTADNVGKMLRAWGPEGQGAMRDSLLIDFPFMLSYALAFAGITLLIARSQSGRPASAGLALTPAALIAAVFDALENLMLLTLLGRDPVPALPPLVAGISASIKFLLLIAVLVYWIASGAAWIMRRVQALNS